MQRIFIIRICASIVIIEAILRLNSWIPKSNYFHSKIVSILIISEFVWAETLISYCMKLCFHFGPFSFQYFDSFIKSEFKDIGTSAICYQIMSTLFSLWRCHFVQFFWGDSSKSAIHFLAKLHWYFGITYWPQHPENNWVEFYFYRRFYIHPNLILIHHPIFQILGLYRRQM